MAKHHITAIIYSKNGQVLSIGKNSYTKTHPLQARHAIKTGNEHRAYLHAEIHAIVRCKDLDKAHSMMITRFDSNGRTMLAKPCEVCMSALREAGIINIKWTT